jgi:hypothetical protein
MKAKWKSQLLRYNHLTADNDTEMHALLGVTVLIITGKVAPLDHKTLRIHSSYVVAEGVFRVVNVWCAFREQSGNELMSYCSQQNQRVSFPKSRYVATTTVSLILLDHFS